MCNVPQKFGHIYYSENSFKNEWNIAIMGLYLKQMVEPKN